MPDHQPIDPDVLARAIADDRSAAEHRAHGLHPVRLADGTLVYAAPDVLINANAGTVLAESIARGAFPQHHVAGAVDSLGYSAALGYDTDDDYTGPDLDVDTVIAAANDATREGAIRHDYLRAIRGGAHLRAGYHAISDAQHAPRYLDDEPADPSYD